MAKKPKKTDIWMPLYIPDYLGDTMHLTTEQHGAYLLLLMAAWRNRGLIENDQEKIRAITRMSEKSFKASSGVLLSFFKLTEDGYRHSRIDEEIIVADSQKKQKSEAGKASAEKRKAQRNGNGSSTAGQRPFNGMANETATEWPTKPQRQGNPSPSPNNLPTVVIKEDPPSHEKQLVVDTDTGEVLWAE